MDLWCTSLKLCNLIMNDNKLLAISPTPPGLKATFLPIYQVPDNVYPPFCLLGKMYYAMFYLCTYTCTVHTNPKSDVENTCHPFLYLLMEKRGNFLCKFIFNCVKDSKLQNGTREACKYCVNLMLLQCQIEYSLQSKKLFTMYKVSLLTITGKNGRSTSVLLIVKGTHALTVLSVGMSLQ